MSEPKRKKLKQEKISDIFQRQLSSGSKQVSNEKSACKETSDTMDARELRATAAERRRFLKLLILIIVLLTLSQIRFVAACL